MKTYSILIQQEQKVGSFSEFANPIIPSLIIWQQNVSEPELDWLKHGIKKLHKSFEDGNFELSKEFSNFRNLKYQKFEMFLNGVKYLVVQDQELFYALIYFNVPRYDFKNLIKEYIFLNNIT